MTPRLVWPLLSTPAAISRSTWTLHEEPVRLEALHTPGHTPEHMSFLLFDQEQGEEAIGVFTGDTLFNLDVGRPDLVGDDGGEENAKDL